MSHYLLKVTSSYPQAIKVLIAQNIRSYEIINIFRVPITNTLILINNY